MTEREIKIIEEKNAFSRKLSHTDKSIIFDTLLSRLVQHANTPVLSANDRQTSMDHLLFAYECFDDLQRIKKIQAMKSVTSINQ